MTVNRAPVILVPGAFGQDFVYWNVMEYLLERDGFPVYSVTFPLLTLADLRESAKLLKAKVEEVRVAEGADDVYLVSHSMGGLISRYYLRHLDGDGRVRHLVCMGVPHKGTWAGLTLPALRGTRQVLPGSAFMNELNAPGAPEVPVTNIYSNTDFVVLPPSSARLPLPGVTNHCARLAGHWGLLVSPRVYQWVRDALDAPPGGALDTAAHEGPARAAAKEDATGRVSRDAKAVD